MGRREAAAGDEDVRGVADHERPIGDADRGAVGQVPPDRVGAAPVVLDRRAAQPDRIRECAAREDVVRASAGSRRTPAASRGRRCPSRARPATPARSRAPGRRGTGRTRAPVGGRPSRPRSGTTDRSRRRSGRRSSRRNESSRVMTVATIPSTGVMWSLPSRRGRSYVAGLGRLGHQRVERGLRDRPRRRSRSTLTIRNVVVSVCAGSISPARSKPNPANAHRSASPDASMKTRRADPAEAGPGRDDDRVDPAVADLRRPGASRGAGSARRPRSTRSLPDDLQVLGEVGDAGPGAVRVRVVRRPARGPAGRPRRHRRSRRRPCVPATRRVEAVERVEDRGARPAEERQPVHEQDGGAATGRGDRGARSGRARPRRRTRRHSARVRDTAVVMARLRRSSRRPTSRHRPRATCPVTTRDSSDRK